MDFEKRENERGERDQFDFIILDFIVLIKIT
jgi:hypothetical protein